MPPDICQQNCSILCFNIYSSKPVILQYNYTLGSVPLHFEVRGVLLFML